jgi:hypothetical protein
MEKALDFLLEFGKGSDGGVGVALVQRPGGTEAAMNRYSELVIAGGAPDMRRLLISGMSDPVVLLGVAATDPVADVRGQALLAVSASGDPEVWHKCLGLLEQSIGAPQESAQSSAPYQAAYSAVNLAKRSLGRDAAVLDRAADLLRNLLDGGALDQRTGDFVRAELEGLGLGH